MKTEIRKLFLRPGLSIFFFSLVLMPLTAVAQDWPSTAIRNSIEYKLGTDAASIGDLASLNHTHTDRRITILQEGMIMATAQVHIENAVRTFCALYINDGSVPVPVAMSDFAYWHEPDLVINQLTKTLVGFLVKPPGTYNVMVKCKIQSPLTPDQTPPDQTNAILRTLVVWTAPHQVPPPPDDPGPIPPPPPDDPGPIPPPPPDDPDPIPPPPDDPGPVPPPPDDPGPVPPPPDDPGPIQGDPPPPPPDDDDEGTEDPPRERTFFEGFFGR